MTTKTPLGADERAWLVVNAIIWAAAAIGAALLICAPAHADTPSGPDCQTVPWGFLGSQNRTICDGPLHPDGSWTRKRTIWTEAHTVPARTTCYSGTSTLNCTTYGGYFVNESLQDQQLYTVTPDTVLPDEPGHLG
jgi:hypothetical protein